MKKIMFFLVFCIFSIGLFAQTEEIAEVTEEDFDNDIILSVSANVQEAMSNPEYLVTPGDVYSLSYAAGSVSVSYTIFVDSTYKIRVANLAKIDTKGKTFINLKKEVEDIVSKNYPMSGVQFVLMKPAIFTVNVTGEVKSTVEKKAWALTRVSSVLGNVRTAYSSSRYVTIKRADGTVKKCDLFLATRFGDFSQNPYLRPGDVIEIPREGKTVSISGAVERPGTYELKPEENLVDLINYYGNGLTPFSDLSRIEVGKVSTNENVNGEKIYLNVESLENPKIAEYVLEKYDSVFINSYSNIMPVVFVEGAILSQNQGATGTQLTSSDKMSVQFHPGENYAFFIRRIRNVFTSVSDFESAYIVRKDQIIPINLNDILYDATYYSDLYLEEDDVLNIPFKQFFVSVSGAVLNPGKYPYIPDRDYMYYVNLAGGFDPDRNAREKVSIVDMHGEKKSTEDAVLPEFTIMAENNSFTYFFNKYAPIITTVLSLITTFISVQAIITN